MRLGIIGAANIAFDKFLPALKKVEDIQYVGVASRTIEKTERFVKEFGGVAFSSYDELLLREDIDCVYIPLPPALHFQWGKKAIEAGKHVLMEKPLCTSIDDSTELLRMANEHNVVLYENYMFLCHRQLDEIKKLVDNGAIGKTRFINAVFTFPRRDAGDFRYNKKLGGGALLDCGGYPIRVLQELMGEDISLEWSKLCYGSDEVDIYGAASFTNKDGVIGPAFFGMDNSYRCDLEIQGSLGKVSSPRIFTAPALFDVTIKLEGKNEGEVVVSDDHFKKSIERFMDCIDDLEIRKNMEKRMVLQAEIIDGIMQNQ